MKTGADFYNEGYRDALLGTPKNPPKSSNKTFYLKGYADALRSKN